MGDDRGNTCIVCGGHRMKTYYNSILRCHDCGYVVADMDVCEKKLFELYSRDYFFGGEYSDYIRDKKVLQKNFALRFKVLRKFLDPARHKHLLEIGCAYGFFLDTVRNSFETVLGVDITEEGVRYAREQLHLDVIQGDFLKYDFGDQRFDVVCLWDTIEHLSNPHLYLDKISRHTKGGSLLAMTTGDIESLNARLRKDRWRLMHPPTHIHYFSKRTLTKLLDRYGFDVIYNRYCGFYRSLDNIAYNILVLRKKWQKLYALLRKVRLTEFNLYLNLYDIMYLIARKR